MNITFLIGNGFDLRVGMKTRFADMYENYIAKQPTSDAVRKLKKMLKEDAPKYKTWGDFEMAMAEKAKEFEDEISFIECLRDFKLHMAEHLEKEQTQFLQRLSVSQDARKLCTHEMGNSLEDFYAGLTPNVVNELSRLGVRGNARYSCISFNYTRVFDNLISPYVREVMHIHGTLEAGVALGADNLGQVNNLPYMTTKRFERAFIKPEFNKSYDIARLTKVESIIDKSDVICIYGMSLGKSDLSWTIRIKNWLLSHEHNHLVYFTHDEREFNKLNWDAIIDEEEDRIAALLGKLCDSGEEMMKIFNQIHIPVGYDIFGIDEILITEKNKVDDDKKKREALRKQLEEIT